MLGATAGAAAEADAGGAAMLGATAGAAAEADAGGAALLGATAVSTSMAALLADWGAPAEK